MPQRTPGLFSHLYYACSCYCAPCSVGGHAAAQAFFSTGAAAEICSASSLDETDGATEDAGLADYTLGGGGGGGDSERSSSDRGEHHQTSNRVNWESVILANVPMIEEVCTMSKIVANLLGSALGPDDTAAVRTELFHTLCHRYAGHWHEHDPLLGSGFRSILITRTKLDPVLVQCLGILGQDAQAAAAQLLLGELTIFCDPGYVAMQAGDFADPIVFTHGDGGGCLCQCYDDDSCDVTGGEGSAGSASLLGTLHCAKPAPLQPQPGQGTRWSVLASTYNPDSHAHVIHAPHWPEHSQFGQIIHPPSNTPSRSTAAGGKKPHGARRQRNPRNLALFVLDALRKENAPA